MSAWEVFISKKFRVLNIAGLFLFTEIVYKGWFGGQKRSKFCLLNDPIHKSKLKNNKNQMHYLKHHSQKSKMFLYLAIRSIHHPLSSKNDNNNPLRQTSAQPVGFVGATIYIHSSFYPIDFECAVFENSPSKEQNKIGWIYIFRKWLTPRTIVCFQITLIEGAVHSTFLG